MTFAHLTVVWLLLALCYVPSVVLSQSASAVFAVTGFLSGVDFVVEYSFQATSTLLVGPVGDVNAVYLVTSVSGTRTFINTTTNSTTVASLTLLPLYVTGFNNNTLYANSPTLNNNHKLFDWDGLAFSLSQPEYVAGYTNQTFSTVNLWWDSTAVNPSTTEQMKLATSG